MSVLGKEYSRKKRKLCVNLDKEIYRILSTNPMNEWDLTEIQDRIEEEWHIRPYKATILRHADDFYREHHIPLFNQTNFDSDKYKLNTEIDKERLNAIFFPKRGRPSKKRYTNDAVD